MSRYRIPSARHRVFTDLDSALGFIQDMGNTPVVIKANLARGTRTALPRSRGDAREAVTDMMTRGRFGPAGPSVTIEEILEGEEVSVLSLCDGDTFKMLPPVQVDKRAGDGDQGPITEGMGGHCPTPFVTPSIMGEIERMVIKPTLDGMVNEGELQRGRRSTANINGLTISRNRAAVHWSSLHEHHTHTRRSEGRGLQRPLQRCRDADADAAHGFGLRSCSLAAKLLRKHVRNSWLVGHQVRQRLRLYCLGGGERVSGGLDR